MPMNFNVALELLFKHIAPRERHAWLGGDRAHVELRAVDVAELDQVAQKLVAEVQKLPEVLWAEVHHGTYRAVLCFRPGKGSKELAVALVAQAELAAGVERAQFGPALHPSDSARAERALLELVAELVGLIVGGALSVSFFPRSRLAGGLASSLAVLRAVPRLRRSFDERWGEERVDVLLGMLIGLLQGPAQRPLQSLVGVLEKATLREELERQARVWTLREPELTFEASSARPRARPDRPVPLPRGPIEEYADRAWAVALGGFAVSFLSTRSVQRAFGALFGGIPRPARLGREVFSAGVSRLLAGRRVLIMNSEALRLLDRVDCLVLQGELMPGSASSLGRAVIAPGRNEQALLSLAREHFDPKAPLAVKKRGGVTIGPLGALGIAPTGPLRDAAEALGRGGELVLGLKEGETIVLVCEVRTRTRLGLEELVDSAHEAGMKVIVASSDPEILQTIPADETLPPGDDLWRGVRQLQREGHVVCVVSQGDSRALDAADLAVALAVDGAKTPWSAHVVTGSELEDVRFLIEAARTARIASRQSVNVALGAATLGAIASVGRILPITTNRVLTIVNVASLVSMASGVRHTLELARRQLPPARDPTPWHALEADGVLARLGTSSSGLSQRDVLSRQTRGQRRSSALLELTSAVSDELFNPLVPLLAAGAGLSAVVGSMSDAVMVGGVIGLNAVVGGVQKFQTERAITALSRSPQPPCRVRRSGQVVALPAEELVRGDIVLLTRGDLIQADCRLLEAEGLTVDAAGLTGESLPVPKGHVPSFEESIADRSSMLYAGTRVTSGQASAVVVATGSATEARRGAATFRANQRETGVEKRMRELMDMTAPIALAAGIGVLGTGLLRGRRLDELVTSAVSLAVASVPEGLPLLATAAQLAAARRLSVKGALVRNVRALEPLGRVDTVCLDKTGTVTEGTVELAEAIGVFERPDLIELGALAGPERPLDLRHTDPVDRALFLAVDREGSSLAKVNFRRAGELPFDAGRAYSGAYGASDQGRRLLVKGAPESIFDALGTPAEPELQREVARLREKAEAWARDGLRVLAVAERIEGAEEGVIEPDGALRDLTLLGILAFHDPIRASARSALADLKRAGLRPVLVTGDHPSTARAVAQALGLSVEPYIITGAELSVLDEDTLQSRAPHVDVFARVAPSQKVRIVRALTRAGRTVAMVGDGANDAPAIRLASVGVAMGEHSAEAARNAADIVLTEARIEALVDAIVEGRALWDAVRDAVSILVGGNLGEIGFTLGAGLISGRPPLTPRQLLLVNLFTDVAPATALALRAPKARDLRELLEVGPEASLGFRLSADIGARAATTALGAGLAWAGASLFGGRRGASTTALLALVGTQLGQTLASGNHSKQVVITNVVTAGALAAIVQTPGLSGVFGCRPLGPLGWSMAIGSSVLATSLGRYAPSAFVDWFTGPSGRSASSSLSGLMDRTGRAAEELGVALIDGVAES